MKKRLLLLVAVALLLPGAAFADNIEELQFSGGTLSGNDSGFTLAGASVTAASAWYGYVTGSDLANVSFTTNNLADGSAGLGADILPGGTVTITGTGNDPNLSGNLFAGTFTNGATWSFFVDPTSQDYIYTLSGAVNGITNTDTWTDGTFQFTIDRGPQNTFGGYDNGANASGYAVLAVPEPGSLSLMGTGLLGLLGAIRRKIKA